MATPPKKKPTGGRVTPKGTRTDEPRSGGAHPGASRRYTPPTPDDQSPQFTAPWVLPTMFTLLGLGALTIVLNYIDVLPGGISNWYLFAGLGFILGGIVTATKLH